jgi:hypothetical protein
MLWLASRSKSRTVYKPLPLGMGFMTEVHERWGLFEKSSDLGTLISQRRRE